MDAYGGIDILVVASGMNDVSPIVDMAPERFARVMQANVEGAWLIARAAGRQMIAQAKGGKVVFTSSARGKLGHPAGYSAYCASKSAVDGMTKALGCEWGKYGITVNAIAPTVFRSPLTAWMFEDNDNANKVRAGFLARVPIGRLGEPADPAGPLLFLCCALDFHTGHVVMRTAAIPQASGMFRQRSIAIVGGGLMGAGIAQVFAGAGHAVNGVRTRTRSRARFRSPLPRSAAHVFAR